MVFPRLFNGSTASQSNQGKIFSVPYSDPFARWHNGNAARGSVTTRFVRKQSNESETIKPVNPLHSKQFSFYNFKEFHVDALTEIKEEIGKRGPIREIKRKRCSDNSKILFEMLQI